MKINSKLSAWFAAAIVTCFLPHAGAAATLIDVGTLNGHDSANAFSISGNGQVTGRSFSSGSPSSPRCFRTLANTALNETSDPAANVHSFLSNYFGGYIMNSTGYDIEQSISGGIEIAGELLLYSTPRAFWYSEVGSSRSARLLSLAYQGTSSSAAALKTGPYGSVVVGHCMANGLAQACLWAVSGTNEWLYNYGGGYFAGKNSWATDTDMNRTIGYYEYSFKFIPFIVDGQTGPKYDLPVGGGGDSAVAFGMYTSGTTTRIVGYTYEFLQKRASLWTYTGSGNVSQVLLDKYGYQNASAQAINDAGQIVGSVWNTSPAYVEKACFWRVSGGGGVLDDGTFNMDLVRGQKVGPSSTSSKVAGIGVNKSTGLSRGFILDHAD